MLLDRYSALSEDFERNFPDVPIVYENQEKPSQIPFVRITFVTVSNVRSEIGNNGSDRMDGYINIDIYTKLGIGIGKSIEISDSIMDIYTSGRSITTDEDKIIHFTAPQIVPGREDGYGYYQRTIQCPWYTFKY